MAIFVIIAIVIVGAVVAYLAISGRINLGGTAGEFQSIFDRQTQCIELATRQGAELAGLQGGRVDVGAYAAGSDYAPFSSHLNFLGTSVPYWYSLSANGVYKENVPTKADMEREIGDFVEQRLGECDFSDLYEQGYEIERGAARASVSVLDSSVRTRVTQQITVRRGEASASISSSNVEVSSQLGKFYDVAKSIYDNERSGVFLENYAVDVLRNYAPVDGVAVSCAPRIWKTQDVVTDLRNGLESNFGALTFKGPYASDNSYFVVDAESSVPARVLYDTSWPSTIDVTPADEALMIAEPVGNDATLGAAGFCYIPYHFVYDVRVPVLFQLYDGETLFQFPVTMILSKNVPREPLATGLVPEDDTNVCTFSNTPVTVQTYDATLAPVEASISYQCFDSLCPVGTSRSDGEQAVLNGLVPACLNGVLQARAEGYATKRVLFSSNSETHADIVLDREYSVMLDLTVNGQPFTGNAIVQFAGAGKSVSAAYPESKEVRLSEGQYNITVYAYGNSSIVIPASTKTQCQDVPRPGLAGFFGSTQEQCFDINLPETKIDYALLGGGTSSTYLLASQLATGQLTIGVPRVPAPSSLEEAQYAFESVARASLEVGS